MYLKTALYMQSEEIKDVEQLAEVCKIADHPQMHDAKNAIVDSLKYILAVKHIIRIVKCSNIVIEHLYACSS